MPKTIEIREFAQRVERLCDFLLNRMREEGTKDKSANARIIEDLRDDAADIQFNRTQIPDIFDGLEAYVRGIPQIETRSEDEVRPGGDQ